MTKLIIILFLFVQFSIAKQTQVEIAVIVNKGVVHTMGDNNELLDIYTLKKKYWDNGNKIVLVDYKGDSEIKESFYNNMNITRKQLQKIWLRKQFSGKGYPPKTFKTEQEILKKVANTEGAIAYVYKEMVTEKVKILAVITQ